MIMKICLSEEFAQTIGDIKKLGDYDIEHGVSIRNKFILNSILNGLAQKGVKCELIILHKKFSPFNLSYSYIIPFLISKYIDSLNPCSYVFLEKLSKGIKLSEDVKNCNIVILHHGFSLIKYYHILSNVKKDAKPLVWLEMPENLIETVAYTTHKRYCIESLEKILHKGSEVVDIVTSPTLRDTLYYAKVFKTRHIFTIYNVYNVFPDTFTDTAILTKKNPYTLCISIGSWYTEAVYRFIEEVARLINDHKLGVEEIHVLGTKTLDTIHMGNIKVYYYPKMRLKQYYEVLSQCIITVLYPRTPWSGGHSVRLNDAALMGNVIMGSDFDLRGEPYEYQYTYIDPRDLVTKLHILLENRDRLLQWGMRNREIALERVKRNKHTLDMLIDIIISQCT
jgi:hypothetical protein